MIKWDHLSKIRLVQHSKINISHHMNRLKKKNDDLNRYRKAFDIIQHLFTIKISEN